MNKAALPLILLLLTASGCSRYPVPRPQPVHSDIEISAFYYPGTEQMAEWDMVEQTYPHIKPLLGWYDESNPEVIDWQIKWACEHGISSFAVDWYWNQGVRRLEHWVTGFYKARWRSYLKWYLMWANHNEPGSHSTADQLAVTQYWIDNYFKTPEYYRIDGRPVVIIWSLDRLDEDFIAEAATQGVSLGKGEGAKKALALSDSLARASGLKGIYFIDMLHRDSKDATMDKMNRAEAAGYEAQMVYNFHSWAFDFVQGGYGNTGARRTMGFDMICEGVQKWWAWSDSVSTHHIWPIIPTGWDDTPRSFNFARVVEGRTPENFLELCRKAREYCEKTGHGQVIIAPLNEWQEGSYIEPNEEFGFGMYDALREAFCTKPAGGWPRNICPSDVDAGPYDYPRMEHPARTSWDFEDGVQGWYRNPYGTTIIKSVGGRLHFVRTQARMAAIRTRIAPFDAELRPMVRIRMKVEGNHAWAMEPTGNETMTLWFGSGTSPIFDGDFSLDTGMSVSQPVIIDGEYHDYTFDMTANPRWTGMIEELWFNPADLQHAIVDIESIEITGI